MAKGLRRTKDVAGFNDQGIKAAQASIQKKQATLEYVFDSVSYTLNLETVKPNKILEETIVFEGNEREQSWLNENALVDIISTLKGKNGQLLYPALGFRSGNKIVVVEGSRRRMSCYYAQKDFLVYVSNKPFGNELANSLSVIGNAHRTISICEKGLKYKKALDSGQCKSNADIERLFGEHKSTVSVALKSTRLPREILDSFPAPTFIGKKIIDDLSKWLALVSDSEFRDFKEVIKKIKLPALEDRDPVKLNALYFQALFDEVKSVQKISSNYKTLSDDSALYRVSFNEKKRDIKLELKGLNQEHIEKFRVFCTEIGISL